ncbi:MAG: hypothetical protein KUG81_09580 [Gammaproteobacteria bacterium]|nr:hypothetical protein [Gammaproteobacteria bacterium]
MSYSPEQVQEIHSEKRIPRNKPFINAELGSSMNTDAAFGGTPDGVHDGTDSVLWTGSQVVGTKVTFDSIDRPQAGTKSVKINNPDILDIWAFTRASTIDLTNYTALTFGINIDKDWTGGDSVSICAWDSGLGQMVGNAVNIEDYITETLFDVWQEVVIPLTALGIEAETIDQFRMEQLTKDGKAAVFYIDTMQIEETGGVTFDVEPDVGKDFYISNVRMVFVNNVTGAPAHEHGDLLGVTLLNGITINRTSAGIERVGRNNLSLLDLYSSGFSKISLDEGATDSILVMEISFDIPVVLRSEDTDIISFGINDNLSTLIHMSAIARGETNA